MNRETVMPGFPAIPLNRGPVQLVAVAALFFVPLASAEKPVDFNRDIRPILSDKCFACHGPDAKHRKGDLRLDLREDVLRDRDGYAVIVPGKPDQSELVYLITAEDEDERMPPKKTGKTLTPQEIELLTRWVRRGADWSEHWAFVPPRPTTPPAVQQSGWTTNWIDRYILNRLEQEGLVPSPAADRRTLARRLSFDLTGLPPDPTRVEAFVQDKSPRAWETLIDEMLASPHYGERMAMYWLDLVRYADTVGYHGDQDHNASPYRDWVIRAFNDNMPFDRFTAEQLAGDLLENPTLDQKVATAYNRLLQTSHEGGVQPKEYLAIYAADRVRNFSSVWMGATVGCAQCHDHKYDPYTMKDFYSLAAFFADIDEAKHFKSGTNSLPTRRDPEIPVPALDQRDRLAAIDQERSKLDPEKDKARIQQLNKERDRILKSARKCMITQAVKPRTMRVLPRGNWLDDSGPVVQPAVPGFMPQPDANQQRLARLDLARWLTDEVKGLTARVFVNRLWYLCFGSGIAGRLDDFGGQGEPPVHPELLDALALEFIRSGWDVKHMMKLITLSSAYRQTSKATSELIERDPYNRLIARQSRWRLPAEMIRDNALAVSGLLVETVGGRPAKPYQPAGYYQHLNFPKRTYRSDRDANQYRRGVYVHWQRMFLHPAMKAFDAPTREECTAQRPISNTPNAALTLLNDPSYVEAARVFALRTLREGGRTEADRIDWAFRWATSRPPRPAEAKVLKDLLARHRNAFAADRDAAVRLGKVGQAETPEDPDPAERAAWTSVCRTLLNLNETITRN